MAAIDLDALNLDELKALRKDVQKSIDHFEDRKKREAIAAVEAKARELGFSLNQLVGTTKKGRAPAVAKYQHPENPELTWTGRGRQPRWVKEHVDSGKPLEELAIQSS